MPHAARQRGGPDVSQKQTSMNANVPFSRTILAALVVAVSQAAVGIPDKRPSPGVTIDEVAGAFKSYEQMTAQAVSVNPELAMLCIGATQSQVEAARKTNGPHAHSAILIYMNGIAARDFRRADGAYEPGAVIVKEKTLLGFRDRKSDAQVRATDHGVGGMIKRSKGFDPTHGDWEYFYFEDVSKIETGRIPSCIKCHDNAKSTGHVFGTWASDPGKDGIKSREPAP